MVVSGIEGSVDLFKFPKIWDDKLMMNEQNMIGVYSCKRLPLLVILVIIERNKMLSVVTLKRTVSTVSDSDCLLLHISVL